MRMWATPLVGLWTFLAVAQSVGGVQTPVVAGKPFTGEDTLVWTHQVNGTTVTTQRVETVARDSEGRVHREGHEFTAKPADPKKTLTSIQILDPVAGTNLFCEVLTHVCSLSAYSRPVAARTTEGDAGRSVAAVVESAGVAASIPSRPGRRAVNVENLGVQTLDGLEVTGTRRTISLTPAASLAPSGSPGEALAISSVESWFSRDLMTTISQTRSFPNGDLQVSRLKVLGRGEPDASLFAVGAGFTIEDDRDVRKLGGGVKAPVVISSAEPEFSEEARRNKMGGNVLVHVVVNEQGLPTRVRVVRGLGLGLDENAVKAVKTYRFKPAMEDGKAVAVEITVSVNFQIF